MGMKAIIFDCDGTLVDTEYLSALSYTNTVRKYGIDLSPEAFMQEFMGLTNRVITDMLRKRFNVDLPFDAIVEGYVAGMYGGMAQHMRVFPETLALVRRLGKKYGVCVASNGNREVVMRELEVAGYLDFIPQDRIFTASQVANPKPAPDLFLYAARAMGADPAASMVVEDSAAGACAGVAAGMKTIGYTGMAHDVAAARQSLEKAGVARVIGDLAELEAALI